MIFSFVINDWSDDIIVNGYAILSYGYIIIVGVVMAFREAGSTPIADDDDKAGIIIDKSKMNLKRVNHKNLKNEETESK